MSTASSETKLRSKGCSLKSEEFVAMMKLRRKGGRATCQRMRTKKKGRWGGGQDGGGVPSTHMAMGMIVKNFLLLVNCEPPSICSQKVKWSYLPWS